MSIATKQLQDISVADVMTSDVITVSVHATAREATQQMSKHRLNSMPVVNEFGRCVGMLSASDLISQDKSKDHFDSTPMLADLVLGSFSEEEICFDLDPETRVQHCMTSGVQTIDSQCSLRQAAACMVVERIHHLAVLDKSSRPVGMLSTMDILEAVLQ